MACPGGRIWGITSDTESGPVLNADAEMQIQYPPHHRDRSVLLSSLLPACMHVCMASTCFSLGRDLGGPASSTQPSPQLPWVELPAPAAPVAKVEFEDRPPPSFFSSSHCCLGRASSCKPPGAGESEHSAMSLFRFVKLSWGPLLDYIDRHVLYAMRWALSRGFGTRMAI